MIPNEQVGTHAVVATCHGNCHNAIDAHDHRRFLDAESLFRSLERDVASLERATNFLVAREGFSQARAERAKQNFIRYMTDVSTTNIALEPMEEVDLFWHAHLLHTQIYMAWCMKHFGYFVHHVPHTESCGTCGGPGGDPPVH